MRGSWKGIREYSPHIRLIYYIPKIPTIPSKQYKSGNQVLPYPTQLQGNAGYKVYISELP